jgi:NAD(P)-dependent dehydrogenase (short-subunit alcohol dehydrogenase family)
MASLFSDKIAFVTGGASGIGRALCEELGRRGAVVIVADIDKKGAQQVASDLGRLRAEAAELDVADAPAVERAVLGAVSTYGRLDYMFNNAAIAAVGEVRDMAPEHWRRLVDVNLLGVVWGSMAAYAVMIRQGSGHIVNVASVTGLIPSPMLTSYSTAKWGVVGFSTGLRAEAAALGVKVSVACPSLVRTNIPDHTAYFKIRKEDYLARLPWNWMMEPDQAANSILRGVVRNETIIVCPAHGHLVWWCYRLCPGLLGPLLQRMVREFRKLRLSP